MTVRGTLALVWVALLSAPACSRLSGSAPAPSASASTSAAAPAPLGSGIRITSKDATHYEVDDDLLALVIVSIASGSADAKHTGSGYELSSVQPGSLLARLGLASGDTIAFIGDVALDHPRAIERAYAENRDARSVDVKIERAGQSMVLSYQLRRRLLPRASLRERPLPARPSRRASDELSKKLEAGIKQVDDTHFEISTALAAELRKDANPWSRSARIIPSQRNGKTEGLRLYGVRSRSVLGKLGVKNGDLVHSVNGHPLSDIDSMLELRRKLADKKQYVLMFTRRGKPLELHYRIVERP